MDDHEHNSLNLISAKVVRKSAAGVDGFDGLADFAGKRVGGGDEMGAGLDLNGAGPRPTPGSAGEGQHSRIHVNQSPPLPSPEASRASAYVEIADNMAGVPVFLSPSSLTSVGLIGYGTKTSVVCYAPNESGTAGVNAFYLIASPPSEGLYAPADGFTNGGPVGQSDVPKLDQRVPPCAGT
jgi:hypothetical protein